MDVALRELLLNNLIEASKIKDKVAIYNKDQNITYSELYRRVSIISENIINTHGTTNEVFGIRMADTLNAFTLILALIFSNKTILPLPMEIPDDKAEKIIDDIKPISVFYDDYSDNNSINFNDYMQNTNGKVKQVEYSNESNFIIIMTSGTTGTPKGCCLKDGAFLGRISDLHSKFGFTDSDNFLFSSNYSFDVSYTQILTWLFGKGSITIQKKADNFRNIPEYVRLFNVTHLALSPAVLKNIYNTLVENSSSIKEVFVVGERFPKIIAEKYIDNPANFNLWNMYGPTEFSIYATYFNIKDYNKEDYGVPIGRGLPGVDVKLLDSSDNLITEPGVEGQILLGGAGLFSEYINNKKKTKDSLITINGKQYYKSGDIGSFINDKLYFHGRIDKQLKINGIRVESEEIEKVILERCSKVDNVVVTLLEYESKKRLVAFIVLKDKKEKIGVSYLTKSISKYIESYFIPKVIITLDEIPLNKNGKVDIKQLTDLYYSSKKAEQKSSLEIILLEKPIGKLIQIWQDVLNTKIDNIEKANFFDLGADSIDVIVLIGEIEEKFKVNLKVEDIYKNPLLRNMIDVILANKNAGIISQVNEELSIKWDKTYLSKINIDDEEQLILFSSNKKKEILKFLYDNYGIEFVPNLIFQKESEFKNNLKARNFESDSRVPNFIKEIIIKNIVKNNSNLLDKIEYGTVQSDFLCGPGQNKIFRKKYNDLVISKTSIESIDEEKVKDAIRSVISKHSLLRSIIIYRGGKYYFKEGTINSKFKIDVLDITKWKNIDKESIKRQVETELFDYVAKMNKENNILYKFVLIKTDEKTYEFTIIFSHLISDAASANIFSKELITKYQEIMGLLNESKNDEFTYKDYLSELSNNYSKSKYLEFVNSKKYQKIKKYSNGKRNNRDLQTYILKVPNETVRNFINDNEEYTKEGILLWLSTKLAKIILDKEKIAYRITNSGRTVGNKKFNNVFGDCHVHYPLIINSDIDSISTCSSKLEKEFKYYYQDKNIYLEDLCYSQNSKKNNNIEQMFDNLDCVFNYIGEMDERSSKIYCQKIKEEKSMFRTLYIYCYATKNDFIINCRLPESCSAKIIEKFNDYLGVK